jgi:hypothetical protein
MTRRNLVHISREPMQLSDVTIQPVLFTVLFICLFGGAIPIPGGGSYTDFILAGLLTLNLTTSTMARRSVWPPTCTRGSSTGSGRCRCGGPRCWSADPWRTC